MKLTCKCGNILTKDVKKVHHKDAYDVVSWDEEVGTLEDPCTYEHKEYSVKEGTYHRWEKKKSYLKYKNVYVVSDKDFLEVEVFNECKGCCRMDHYDVKCKTCGEHIGYGHNDCWQDDAAFLYTIKTKVVQ